MATDLEHWRNYYKRFRESGGHTFSVRLDSETYEDLKKLAAEKKLSMCRTVERLIHKRLYNYTPDSDGELG